MIEPRGFYDAEGILLFSVDPAEITEEGDPIDGYAAEPPPISGYRKADISGLSCWNCGHFTPTGDTDGDGIVDGICNLFEALAAGDCTCDRFTAHADLLRQQPHTSWTEDMQNADRDDYDRRFDKSVESVEYSDQAVLNEIIFSGEATEEDGLVWKDILRTGQWTHTPTGGGIVKKELRIVDEGESDPANGIISLAEVYRNFNEGAVPYVTVPLSDDTNDHKNIARLNTGFVRKLKLVKDGAVTKLRAGIDFTEPDVKGKVLRGTIPDVSAGIPFGVTRRSDNKFFGAVLDHVCLTRKPFIDKLSPFGLAASDGDDDLPVETWESEAPVEPRPHPPSRESEDLPGASEKPTTLSFRQSEAAILKALAEQLRLGPEYQVEDVVGNTAVISHRISDAKWNVGFRTEGQNVILDSVVDWKLIDEPKEEEQPQAVAASNSLTEFERVRELRELRFAQPTSNQGGIFMSALKLDGVELSDEARAQIQSILTENEDLKKKNREAAVNERVSELEELGLKERPGALKLYRQVMLSDDGGPAVILFSDSDDEDKKERLTAVDVLDRFIDALKADGEVVFSDQHFASGNDKKPPLDAAGEKKPLEERVEEARQALHGKRNRRS
jgi:hypothetical protein